MNLEQILQESAFILACITPLLGWVLVYQTAGKMRAATAILSLLFSAIILGILILRFVPITAEGLAKTLGIPEKAEKSYQFPRLPETPKPSEQPKIEEKPGKLAKPAPVIPTGESTPKPVKDPKAVLVKPQTIPVMEPEKVGGTPPTVIPPPSSEEKSYWMKQAAGLLKTQKTTPQDEATKNLVATALDCLSTLFVMQAPTTGERQERQFLLRWKKPFSGADAAAQMHLSNIVTQEMLANCQMIPDKDWKDMNILILGKIKADGPLEVLLVKRIEKITGNKPTSKTVFQNPQIQDPGGLLSLAQIPCYAGIDAIAKKHLGADLTKTNLPSTPGQPILLEAGLNTQAPNRDAQIETIRKQLSAMRAEIIDTWGYIPPITINYLQKQTPVLILSIGRTNTGSPVEKDTHLIEAHPLIKRIWEQSK
jgi:hypothetical protein